MQAADGDNLFISLVATCPGEDSESRSSFTGNSQCLLEPGHASRDSPVFLWRNLSPLLVETLICCCCFSIIIVNIPPTPPRHVPRRLATGCQRSCSSWHARSDPGTAEAPAGMSGSGIEVDLEQGRGCGAGPPQGTKDSG